MSMFQTMRCAVETFKAEFLAEGTTANGFPKHYFALRDQTLLGKFCSAKMRCLINLTRCSHNHIVVFHQTIYQIK